MFTMAINILTPEVMVAPKPQRIYILLMRQEITGKKAGKKPFMAGLTSADGKCSVSKHGVTLRKSSKKCNWDANTVSLSWGSALALCLIPLSWNPGLYRLLCLSFQTSHGTRPLSPSLYSSTRLSDHPSTAHSHFLRALPWSSSFVTEFCLFRCVMPLQSLNRYFISRVLHLSFVFPSINNSHVLININGHLFFWVAQINLAWPALCCLTSVWGKESLLKQLVWRSGS